MSEPDFPSDPRVRRAAQKIERSAVRRCAYGVFTTEGMMEMYAARYPDIPRERWKVIANGFDEEAFRSLEVKPRDSASGGRRLLFLHSGLLYPSERDPTAFFNAICELKKAGSISGAELEIVLRASGNEELYARTIRSLEIDDIVSLRPPIPYREALAEMLSADGLFLFQASSCNHQVPAKAYEYLRAKRPVLAFTDPQGDTAGVLREAGVGLVARFDSTPQIKAALSEFISQVRSGKGSVASDDVVRSHSRRHRAEELAGLLDSLAG
jgi:glycosyltransferase involved in cell wall biosynthesis